MTPAEQPREEQIREAAEKDPHNPNRKDSEFWRVAWSPLEILAFYSRGFISGAEWADANPDTNLWGRGVIYKDDSMTAGQAREALEHDHKIMKEALQTLEAKSHSWVITPDTAHVEMPIHGSYRKLVQEALSRLKVK